MWRPHGAVQGVWFAGLAVQTPNVAPGAYGFLMGVAADRIATRSCPGSQISMCCGAPGLSLGIA
jgi:hypothetical protein